MIRPESVTIGRPAAVPESDIRAELGERDGLEPFLRGLGNGREWATLEGTLPEWQEVFRPTNAYESWLVEQAATLMTRVRHCWKHDRALRMMAIERATT